MLTFSQARENGEYRSLPELDRTRLEFLWYSDFWDGPKNGLLVFDGCKYWFEMFEESADPDFKDFYRRFLVLEITQAQLEEEERWHTLFQEKVGYHTTYGRNEREEVARLKPPNVQQEFYDQYKRRIPRDINRNRAIAWFET